MADSRFAIGISRLVIGVSRLVIADPGSIEQMGIRMASNDWNFDLMTVEEIARVLHVPVSWVYERTRRRGRDRIPHIKLGKYLRFEIDAVRAWVNGMRLS